MDSDNVSHLKIPKVSSFFFFFVGSFFLVPVFFWWWLLVRQISNAGAPAFHGLLHLPVFLPEISALWTYLPCPSRTCSFRLRQEPAASIPVTVRSFLLINWTIDSRSLPSSPLINPHSCFFISVHHPTASPNSVLATKQLFPQSCFYQKLHPSASTITDASSLAVITS